MKALQYLNLIGVLALSGLCIAQWQHDRHLNLEINRLEKIRLQNQTLVSEQDQSIQGLNADLAHFKEQLGKVQTELSEIRQKLRITQSEVRQLAAERDQLKSSITNWVAAVAARDARLKEGNKEIGRLADELNGSITKFNQLATSYNATVQELNDLKTRLSQSPPPGK